MQEQFEREGINTYSYTYDAQTGGLLLNSTPTGFSKEPRPVYAPELDVLGFDKYWQYEKQDDLPYMWAEANCYYYRGTLVAKLKGGNIYTAPEIVIPNDDNGQPILPEPVGTSLRPVDIEAMVAANKWLIDIIEETTVKKILKTYTKYKDKLDCFHVAFSGGKDSCVLLDLVKKTLPKGSFIVVFGDTGMEFPDTYDVIRETKRQCEESDIPFYEAKSHLTPKESWELFGPPSRTLRWCCSVHKSTPQTLLLRKVVGKDDYKGLAFVGVRAHESATRAGYDYLNDGKKIRGQLSHNSILEWTSAEVWLYIYLHSIQINKAYKNGSSRVGCICCPMGGGKAGYIENRGYTNEICKYHEVIRNKNGRQSINIDEFIMTGGWSARKNGRDLIDNRSHFLERVEDGCMVFEIIEPSSEWHEWIKTIDIDCTSITIIEKSKGYIVRINEDILKRSPLYRKLIRQVFRKAAYCHGCKVCVANCTNGALRFIDSKVSINNCLKCQKCHDIDSGCLLYHSLRHPQEGENRMKSLNTMSNHAPKTEWLSDFFDKEDDFFTEHSLGPEQIAFFKRLLKDAGLSKNNRVTPFFTVTKRMIWSSEKSLALILINLACENPQIRWYIENFEISRVYSRNEAEGLLAEYDVKPPVRKSICGAYKRLTETPLGTVLHFGCVTDSGDLVRTKCSISDPRVVLYGLFKFAEQCNDYKEFTLATLLNDSIDRDGISPTRIFGLDREDMVPLLIGLTAKYPEFINASFTHDLEKITLAQDKTSQDVLDLFKGDITNG